MTLAVTYQPHSNHLMTLVTAHYLHSASDDAEGTVLSFLTESHLYISWMIPNWQTQRNRKPRSHHLRYNWDRALLRCRLNEMAKAATGENGAQTRAQLFAITFLMLCHMMQLYGIKVRT